MGDDEDVVSTVEVVNWVGAVLREVEAVAIEAAAECEETELGDFDTEIVEGKPVVKVGEVGVDVTNFGVIDTEVADGDVIVKGGDESKLDAGADKIPNVESIVENIGDGVEMSEGRVTNIGDGVAPDIGEFDTDGGATKTVSVTGGQVTETVESPLEIVEN